MSTNYTVSADPKQAICLTRFLTKGEIGRPEIPQVFGLRLTYTWEEWKAEIREGVEGDKHDLGIAPSTFRKNRRLQENVEGTHLLGVDFDEIPCEEFDRVVRNLPPVDRIGYFTHTMLSGGVDDRGEPVVKPGFIRARLLFRLSKPVTVNFKAFARAALDTLWLWDICDQSCDGPERIFYMTYPKGKEAEWHEGVDLLSATYGNALDVDSIDVTRQPKKRPNPSGVKRHVKTENYVTWQSKNCPAGVDPYLHGCVIAGDCPAKTEHDGGAHAMSLCRNLSGLKLKPAQVAKIFREVYNPRVVRDDGSPYPWTEEQIEHKVESAFQPLPAPMARPVSFVVNAGAPIKQTARMALFGVK